MDERIQKVQKTTKYVYGDKVYNLEDRPVMKVPKGGSGK